MTSPDLNQQPLCIEYPDLEIPQDQDDKTKEDNPKVLVTRPSFPERFTKSKKDEEAKQILETFRKVKVNIPLLDAIKQIPRYAKFLKELCTSKVTLKGNERGLSFSSQTDQLSTRRSPRRRSSTGRPFLKTAGTKIDVHSDSLSMEFDGEIIKFDIYDSMRYPSDIPTALLVDIVDPFVQALSSTNSKDHVKFVLEESLTPMLVQILEEDITVDPNISESIFELESLSSLPLNLTFFELPQSRTELLPSILQAPTLELKELPKHLKYVYLGENNTLPVIISSKLNLLEEKKLIRVLREFKEAIGWTIADIKGLSPSTCMHRILLEEGTKPLRKSQRRLNPLMMEVVKKEILKLLDAGMIFPISDSQWVSPTQVVPKKTGITILENSAGNLVPTRVQNGWRVCIDYRKLNAATRKDHFPFPFIDQMLERLAGRSHYCCLGGYSGFHQIPLAPVDQDKTTFTCPF
ncbi:UNVERIFIED_CONTAM: hypothetical protein Scaly_2694100 [Sesamum calycinum]|uniref:Transposon Ty3-I Gag-Pol polyprotein n=1 Tax=Sesamum calycinum TaxID=2727403 RepID=A0AAW2J718_9LAMI